MNKILSIVDWVTTHKGELIAIYLTVVGAASAFIRLFPNLKINSKILGIIRFIGKYVALNKTVREEDRPK